MEKTNTENKKLSKKEVPGWGYALFRRYVRFAFEDMFYRKSYVLNRENLPEDGPLMIVSDHQNSLNDALALVFAVGKRGERKVRSITRADAFRPPVADLFRWIGLMPAFRMNYDGADTLANNSNTFGEAAEEILNDGTVIIYPEAGHQDKRWLGKFSYGYLRILFDAAEASNFEKEIYLLPSCNHYEDYFKVRTDVLIKFGTPIALSPYYELYKTKPRTAQREINALVHEQISGLMLNITDLENYEAIDFLRETYGNEYARRQGVDPNILPEKLETDKQLFQKLNEEKEKNPEAVEAIYKDADRLRKQIKETGINDSDFDRKPSFLGLLGKGVLMALLLPLFILASIPLLLVLFTPGLILRRFTDVMFKGTIQVIISVLLTIPITSIAVFFIAWAVSGVWWSGLAAIVSLPILFIFVINYSKALTRFIQETKFCFLSAGKRKEMQAVRDRMYKAIRNILV